MQPGQPAVLPGEVIRLLAAHGPIVVWTGSGVRQHRAEFSHAPFEDSVVIFVHPGSATERNLLDSIEVQVVANAPDGSYSLRMEGRAHAGRALSRTPGRVALAPWAPEGVAQNVILAVPFIAERVELVREDGDVRSRHSGLTPAGKATPSWWGRWIRASFSGAAAPLGLFAIAIPFGWLGLQGPEYPGRPLAVINALAAGLALVSGIRLVVVSVGFVRWRVGAAAASDAPYLVDGLVAPMAARRVGAGLLLISLGLLYAISAIWGAELVIIVLGSTGMWLMGPAWAGHLALRRPDPET